MGVGCSLLLAVGVAVVVALGVAVGVGSVAFSSVLLASLSLSVWGCEARLSASISLRVRGVPVGALAGAGVLAGAFAGAVGATAGVLFTASAGAFVGLLFTADSWAIGSPQMGQAFERLETGLPHFLHLISAIIVSV